MAEVVVSKYNGPEIQETNHPVKDLEEWKEIIKAEIGEDDYNLIHEVDITRIIRGYHDQDPRKELTLNAVNIFLKDIKDHDFPNRGWSEIPEDIVAKIEKSMQMCSYGQDKQGHPVMFENVVNYDPEDLKKIYDEHPQECHDYRLRIYSKAWNKKHQEINERGVFMYKHINIFNCEGLGLTKVSSVKNILQIFMNIESELLPETVYKMYMINTSWWFTAAWALIKHFIHPLTVQKINILGSDYIDELRKEIDDDQIPKMLGGSCEVPVPWGDVWYKGGVEPQFPKTESVLKTAMIEEDGVAKTEG